eukprot:TRINITY_DN1204_c0_g1_i2.p1 TRINITY_DN1204_c0_g1~~TRINITY_DN1204_c0_g1_i2.p1  ORF type:complete len:242 (+),score=66.51 TRINITY_DN1204_c0_g1_i2:513-1238(+)
MSTSVLVKNIVKAPDTSVEKVIEDFFSFCGPIERLQVIGDGESATVVSAIVTFNTEEAAKTATLLTNSLINEKPITVEFAQADQVPPAPEQTTETPNTDDSFLGSIVNKAKELDSQIGLSTTVAAGFGTVSSTVSATVTDWQIAEKAKTIGDSVSEKVKEADLGTKTTLVLSSVSSTLSSGVETAKTSVESLIQSNEQVSQGVESVKKVGTTIASTLGSWFSTIGTVVQASASASAPTQPQ